MNSKITSPAKVGLFAIIIIALVTYLTLRVSDFKLSPAGTYTLKVEMKSAEGLDFKTPVMVAGIQVGIVEKITLTDHNTALVHVKIRKGVVLPKDAKAEIRTRGVLGDYLLELMPGDSPVPLEGRETITRTTPSVNFSELARNLNDVAIDLKGVSGTIKKYVGSDDSAFAHIMKNMDRLTENLANFAGNNRQNMDQIVVNLKELTGELKTMVRENSGEVTQIVTRLESITQKIDAGKGTIGKLVNDPTTAEKLNEALEGVSSIVEPVSRLQTELGYHIEYLGKTNDVKNYVSLNLKPRPDKFFMLEFISDPNPSPTTSSTTSTVTSGGVTTSVTTERAEVKNNRFLFSAMLAKKFYDFTIRAGLIESSGGAGIDYNKGPFGIQFSAFNFNKAANQNPHLKVMGTLNLTKGFYVLGGVDDIISKQHGPDWFVGAGLRFLDEDIKSLIGAFGAKP